MLLFHTTSFWRTQTHLSATYGLWTTTHTKAQPCSQALLFTCNWRLALLVCTLSLTPPGSRDSFVSQHPLQSCPRNQPVTATDPFPEGGMRRLHTSIELITQHPRSEQRMQVKSFIILKLLSKPLVSSCLESEGEKKKAANQTTLWLLHLPLRSHELQPKDC